MAQLENVTFQISYRNISKEYDLVTEGFGEYYPFRDSCDKMSDPGCLASTVCYYSASVPILYDQDSVVLISSVDGSPVFNATVHFQDTIYLNKKEIGCSGGNTFQFLFLFQFQGCLHECVLSTLRRVGYVEQPLQDSYVPFFDQSPHLLRQQHGVLPAGRPSVHLSDPFHLDTRHGCHRTPILAVSPSPPPPPTSTTTVTLRPGRHSPTPRRRRPISPSPSAITKIPSSLLLPSPTDAAQPPNPQPAASDAPSRKIGSSLSFSSPSASWGSPRESRCVWRCGMRGRWSAWSGGYVGICAVFRRGCSRFRFRWRWRAVWSVGM